MNFLNVAELLENVKAKYQIENWVIVPTEFGFALHHHSKEKKKKKQCLLIFISIKWKQKVETGLLSVTTSVQVDLFVKFCTIFCEEREREREREREIPWPWIDER